MEGIKKVIFYVCAGIGLLILVWWVGSAAYSAWNGYRWEKKTEEFQMALSKPYREDTYGGRTPEETWGLFLDALKKGDVDLASNYIVPEKREKELEFLKKEKSIDDLALLKTQFSATLEKETNNSMDNKESAYFFIRFKDGDEVQAHSIVFILNPYAKIWKIFLL